MHPSRELVGFILAICFITNIAAVALWDLFFVVLVDRSDCTVSHFLSDWVAKWPMFGVTIGIVLGHLFWPQHRG